MGSAFHQLCPRYSGTLTPTALTAIRLGETFTFLKFCMVQFCVVIFEMVYSIQGKNLNIETDKSKQTQRAFGVKMTSDQHRCDVITLIRRHFGTKCPLETLFAQTTQSQY